MAHVWRGLSLILLFCLLMLSLFDESALEAYRGGFSGPFLGFGVPDAFRPPQSINVSVSPSVITIPFLKNAKNSFNFIANTNSFDRSSVSVGDTWLS
jgi:hypothetical protein